MIVKARIPTTIFIVDESKVEIENLTTGLSFEGLDCQLRMVCDEPTASQEDNLFGCTARAFEFVVKDSDDRLRKLVGSPADGALVKLLATIANRCISALRSFGMVPHLKEIRVTDDGSHEETLRMWSVEYSDDDEKWTSFQVELKPEHAPLILDAILKGMGQSPTKPSVSQVQEYAELWLERWPEVEEAIQENLSPQPEQELIINAIEHRRLKNSRLAVIESIIALEMVLTRFIRSYLSTVKNVPKKRVDSFLGPNLTLSTRLAGVLDLTLEPSEIQRVDLAEIKKVVNWRNSIIHKTGNLPAELSDEEVSVGVNSVFTLIFLLAQKERDISISPEMQKIVIQINADHPKFGYPTLRKLGNHKFSVDFLVVPYEPSAEDPSTFEGVVGDLSIQLGVRDAKFKADKHLTVKFFRIPWDIIARWHGGNLEILSRENDQI